MDTYTFGQCQICKKDKALKNEVCNECENNSNGFINFFNDVINKKDK